MPSVLHFSLSNKHFLQHENDSEGGGYGPLSHGSETFGTAGFLDYVHHPEF
jgi:hypothetical protein